MLYWECYLHVRVILLVFVKPDLLLGVIFNRRPLTIDLLDANAYANNEVKKLARCRCCIHFSNRKWSNVKLLLGPLVALFDPFANSFYPSFISSIPVQERLMGYCFWTSGQRVKPSPQSLCPQSAQNSILGNHRDFPLGFKASFSTCFLSLSRREWRLRTMSTSTWRWRGRMALWCSLRSSGTLHSANWWKPTVNGRWDHNTPGIPVFLALSC